MVTTTTDRAEVFSRPAARFDADGNIEVRASAVANCRRALWYAVTNYKPTNPPSEESLTAMESGNALEPVVARAMERAGWEVEPADPHDPEPVAVRVGPNMIVTGHPDGTVRMPVERGEAVSESATVQMLLFGDEPAAPPYGDQMVVEIKTRGPEAFKRWRTLGAERSHPASVAQAAFYTLGEFGEMRDAVIATMDTGSRTWDWERIPADRLERALQDACEWLGEVAGHHVLNGPDADALPERDFSSGSWQCRSCPFLDICLPGAEEEDEDTEIQGRGGERRGRTGSGGSLCRGSGRNEGAGEGQARSAQDPEGVDASPGRREGGNRRPQGQPGHLEALLRELSEAQ